MKLPFVIYFPLAMIFAVIIGILLPELIRNKLIAAIGK